MYAIVEHAIDPATLVDYVGDAEAGAIATFLGTTRCHNRGRRVLELEYEAYADMAVAEFERIAAEAHRRWELTRSAIVHRVGVVPLGEASVAIAVSAPHRRESIEACHFLIDALKLVAPIWKKERFEGGEVWIGSLADCDHGDGADAASGEAGHQAGGHDAAAHHHGHHHAGAAASGSAAGETVRLDPPSFARRP
jgi:molybdopterin synthase catalytic subunit